MMSQPAFPMPDEIKESGGQFSAMTVQQFNYNLYLIFYLLKSKFINDKQFYDTLEEKLRRDARDKPDIHIRKFMKETKNHRHILYKCTPENVATFLRIAPTIPMLDILNIKERANLMTEDDWEVLWQPLKSMALLAEAKNLVPADCIPEMEKISSMVYQENREELLSGNTDIKQLQKKATKKLLTDPTMAQSVLAMAEKMVEHMEPEQIFPLLSSQMRASELADEL